MVLTQIKDRYIMKKSVVPSWTQKKNSRKDIPAEYYAILPTFPEFVITLSIDKFGEQSRRLLGIPVSTFVFDENGFLVQNAPIDGSIQLLVPTSLRAPLLQRAIIPHWWDVLENERCMSRCDEITTGHTWSRMSTIPLKIVVKANVRVLSSGYRGRWNSFHQLTNCNSSPSIYFNHYQEPRQETSS